MRRPRSDQFMPDGRFCMRGTASTGAVQCRLPRGVSGTPRTAGSPGRHRPSRKRRPPRPSMGRVRCRLIVDLYAAAMALQSNELDIPFHRATSVTVTEDWTGYLAVALSATEGALGRWIFKGIRMDEWSERGLNRLGPWLTERGLAFTSWMSPDPGTQQAELFPYDGPEVDPQVTSRRALDATSSTPTGQSDAPAGG